MSPNSWRRRAIMVVLPLLVTVGCAKYNTYYNAKKYFDNAEHVREEKIRNGEDATKPTGAQITEYQKSIRKCQRVLDEYPGHSLTDDALFLMGKAYHRIESYRMSVSQLNLLSQNYPANPFTEEATFLQALNYMFIGDVERSNDYLDQLQAAYPDSRYQAEALRVSGENAFAVEDWETASLSFNDFLATHPDDENAPRVGLMQALVLWKLRDFAGVADRLEAVLVSDRIDKEDLFDTRLLLARSLSRLERFDEAADLLAVVEPDAEIYAEQGMVTLAKAENAYYSGDPGEASTMLETMPEAWRRGDVLPLAGELQGEIQLEKWDLEQAAPNFRAAANGQRICENPDRVRKVNSALFKYMQMEDRLEGAGEDQRPAYRLVQANALAFGLDRPRLALDVYLEVAEAAELDSLSAVRGLYGAASIYREQLAMPDSAAIVADRLISEFPDSPQAYVLREGENADLYTYLLDRERDLALMAVAASPVDESSETAGEVAPTDPTEAPTVVTPTHRGRYSRWRMLKLERNRGSGRG